MRKNVEGLVISGLFIVLAVLSCCKSSLILPALAYEEPAQHDEGPSGSFLVVCTPDRPIVFSGEAIGVRAWAASPSGQPLEYTWSATGGRLEAKGPEAHWDFTDVLPGIYKATVRVKDPKAGLAEAAVEVVVKSPPTEPGRGGVRVTGRSFLLHRQTEEKGYGLYSYLLFGAPPTDATRERFLKAIEAFLRFPDIEALEKMRLKSKLNVTYLPITRRPEPEALEKLAGGKDEPYRDLAEWLLKYYDYDSAKVMLAGLPGDLQEGPYFLSFLTPYNWKADPSPPYLYQNLSWVPPELVSLWVNEFLNQAAQERFWEERSGMQLALKVRTVIGVAAKALPDVQRSISEQIVWMKSVLK